MTTSVADLRAYVRAGDSDDGFLYECLSGASVLITGYVGEVEVPAEVLSRATLEVAAELYHRRQAPHGTAQFATPDSQPIRIPRDPMVSAYPLLRRWVGGGFS